MSTDGTARAGRSWQRRVNERYKMAPKKTVSRTHCSSTRSVTSAETHVQLEASLRFIRRLFRFSRSESGDVPSLVTGDNISLTSVSTAEERSRNSVEC